MCLPVTLLSAATEVSPKIKGARRWSFPQADRPAPRGWDFPRGHYEAVLTSVLAIRTVVVRRVWAPCAHVGELFSEIFLQLEKENIKHAGSPFAIFYGERYKERDVDVEAGGGWDLRRRDVGAGGPGRGDSWSTRKPMGTSSPEFPPTDGGPSMEVYLKGPGGPFAPMSTQRSSRSPWKGPDVGQ